MAQYTVGNVRGRQTYTNDGGGYSSQQSAQKALTPSQDYINRTNQMVANYKAKVSNNTPSYSSGGGEYTAQPTPDYTPSYSAPSVSSAQKAVDDELNKIRKLIAERAELERSQYKTRYDQQLAQGQNDWEEVMRQNNKNYKLTDNWIRSLYGDTTGGLSNRTANRTQWNNNNYKNNQGLANWKSTALAEYNRALADITARESESLANRVIPVLTNREINENNLSYRERANLQDLDYRRYLASIGLM